MTRVRDRTALRHLRTLLNGGAVGLLADGPLLERFASGADTDAELAFASLVERHGPTVLRVCRSVLADRDAAEDAFQATFLVLVRKASAIRVRDSLGPWLVGVAYRTAASARAASARRLVIEHDAARPESRPPSDPERQELEQAIRDEVDRLPALYRRPVLLCYFGGLTHDQAARQLGCPVGTIRSRLSSARQRLHVRLTRRGLAPAAGIAILLSAGSVRASVPATLLRSTMRLAWGDGGVFSASVSAQAVSFSRAMLMLKLKWVAASLLAAGIVAAGGIVLGQQGAGAPGQDVAAKKEQLGLIAVPATTPGTQLAPATPVPSAEHRGRQIEMLLRAARKQEELGNNQRALELTGQMDEALRSWRTRLQRHVAAQDAPARPAGDHRALITKQDVERAAVPFPDAKKIEALAAADWIAMTERRRRSKALGLPLVDRDDRTKAILSELNERMTASFPRDVPLENVLKYIKSITQSEELDLPSGIPIYVDPIGLEETKNSLASPVMFAVEAIPLKDALRLVLDQLGLTYTVKDGLLTITSAPRPDPPKP
jgi:RNA polymerase sigma factor (sigma-70 family)